MVEGQPCGLPCVRAGFLPASYENKGKVSQKKENEANSEGMESTGSEQPADSHLLSTKMGVCVPVNPATPRYATRVEIVFVSINS